MRTFCTLNGPNPTAVFGLAAGSPVRSDTPVTELQRLNVFAELNLWRDIKTERERDLRNTEKAETSREWSKERKQSLDNFKLKFQLSRSSIS